MPVVTEIMHMGILRSNDTRESAVRENTAKTQRTLYSLMSSGLHGENGLDPETCTHLLQTYVLPAMVYGFEVPNPALVEKLNKTDPLTTYYYCGPRGIYPLRYLTHGGYHTQANFNTLWKYVQAGGKLS